MAELSDDLRETVNDILNMCAHLFFSFKIEKNKRDQFIDLLNLAKLRILQPEKYKNYSKEQLDEDMKIILRRLG